MKIKIGVIGIGAMGFNHVRVFSEMPNVELKGILDKNAEKAGEVSKRFNCRSFDTVDDLLDEVDAVSIAVPTPLHKDVAVKSLEAGKPTLVEKPICADVSDARSLVALAKKNNCLLMVGHIERFNPAVTELKKILYGQKIIQIESKRYSPPLNRKMETDVILDLMIHDIDVIRYLTQAEPVKISAFGGKSDSKFENYATALLCLNNGTQVVLSANMITERKIRTLDVALPGRFIQLDYINQEIDIYSRSLPSFSQGTYGLTYRHENIIEKVAVYKQEPLKLELQNFVDSILNKKTPLVDASEGLKNLEIAEKIIDSIRTT